MLLMCYRDLDLDVMMYEGEQIGQISARIQDEFRYDQLLAVNGKLSLENKFNEMGVPIIFPIACLDSLRVPDEYRRRGIGSKALAGFEAKAREEGCKVVFCLIEDVEPGQLEENIQFYKKNRWGIYLEVYGEQVSEITEDVAGYAFKVIAD